MPELPHVTEVRHAEPESARLDSHRRLPQPGANHRRREMPDVRETGLTDAGVPQALETDGRPTGGLPGRIALTVVAHASGGPRLTWPCARKIRSSSSGDGRGVPSGGSSRAVAGTDASRTMRSRPAGVLRTSTRAPSLSTRKVCGTPIGTAAAPPASSTKRSLPA